MALESQQKFYRAGTEEGPSFDLKDESIDEGTFFLSIYLSYTPVFVMYSRNQVNTFDLPVALLCSPASDVMSVSRF